MKKALISIIHSVLYPFLYLGSQVFVSMIATVVYMVGAGALSGGGVINPDNIGNVGGVLSGDSIQIITIASCLITCLVVAVILLVRRSKGLDTLEIKTIPLGQVITVVLLGISLNMATVYLINFIPIPETMLDQYQELVGDIILGNNFWLTFISTGILVPITEELIFRGMAFNVLRRGMSIAVAFVLQTLLFAGVHLVPLQILYVLPAAAILGLVYIWSGNFLVPVILHMTYNGFSVAINYLSPSVENTVEPAPISYLPYIAVSVVVVAVCLVILYKRRDRGMLVEHEIGV